ncbi:MAG: DUF6132 family protein [Bacteroidales bacterium]|jgi:hypothetical protein|nr:DUF6132 family protein [Bacteroidales bacterium]
MNKILTLIKREWLIIAGGVAGAAGGYLYWYFIGCNSGTCAITSSPLNSTLYGIVLGGLVFSLFKNKNNETGN